MGQGDQVELQHGAAFPSFKREEDVKRRQKVKKGEGTEKK